MNTHMIIIHIFIQIGASMIIKYRLMMPNLYSESL